MADGLNAEMINDPVLGGAGERLDPGVLLTPAAGKRARVSVISCIGLPNDDQRQTFVNQLQLALFSWVKRNLARDRPLGGLFVLDEAQTFVSSRTTTASTQSTLTLASQARKYGLGMVYATQAPKAPPQPSSSDCSTHPSRSRRPPTWLAPRAATSTGSPVCPPASSTAPPRAPG